MAVMYAILGLFFFISTVFSQSGESQLACGNNQPLKLTASKGNIYSPGYLEGRTYPPNSRCSYYIEVPRNRNLMFEIKYMDLEPTEGCGRDMVQVIDAEKQFLIGRFCGSNITEKFLIDSSVVQISFHSDHIVSGRGFHIAYKMTTLSSLCQPQELACRNRKCVASSAICNLRDDCGDGSDEENCRQKRNQKSECGVPSITPTFDSGDRIVGGQEAVPGSWPWQADLQIVVIHPNGHSCGGSLINSQWAVTAAHCFTQYQEAEVWRIHLGNHHKFMKDSTEQIRYAKDIYFYNNSLNLQDEQGLIDNDIALIKLNAEVEFTRHVSPVCLPPSGFQIPNGTKCYASGWGNSRGSGGNDVLKQTSQIIVEWQKCTNSWAQVNGNTMVCSANNGNNGGVCHGDSGGPLVCEINKKWYLIGIASFGTDITLAGGLCGIRDIPTIFQKVSSKTSWIQNILSRYG